MGGEFRTKGVNVFLGPVVSPLGRTVTSGRNWEGKRNKAFRELGNFRADLYRQGFLPTPTCLAPLSLRQFLGCKALV